MILSYSGLEIVAKDPFTNDSSSNNLQSSNAIKSESIHTSLNPSNNVRNSVVDLQPLSSQAAPSYKEKLYTETIQLMTEGVFSLSQLCKVVSVLSGFQVSEDPVFNKEITGTVFVGDSTYIIQTNLLITKHRNYRKR